jgi:phosphatidylserine decarboxylase
MSEITSIKLPKPIKWDSVSADATNHIDKLTELFADPFMEGYYIQALCDLRTEVRQPNRMEVAVYWMPYLEYPAKHTLKEFFTEWLTYAPTTKSPDLYIERWDYLANTIGGMQLSNEPHFKIWFREFLHFHGQWINSTSSTGTLKEWMKYKGGEGHPFHIENYKRPDPDSPTGGFKSFNQFFLRNLKGKERPLCKEAASGDVIVAPCDGGVFYLDRGASAETRYELPGKSDTFNLKEAIPHYGELFVGGPLLDILLWFTDYHHFHAPVSGEVIFQGLYEGSFNYDFGDFDPEKNRAPELASTSDKVGWYNNIGKHQRYVWVIRTEKLGLVAMIAIGFWGVGSIINAIETGAEVQKGEYMGHFGYGGSSIVLAFEPDLNLQFKVGKKPVEGPNFPVQMNVRECLGKRMETLNWK